MADKSATSVGRVGPKVIGPAHAHVHAGENDM
jgi:hypothetical protein